MERDWNGGTEVETEGPTERQRHKCRKWTHIQEKRDKGKNRTTTRGTETGTEAQ